MHRTFWLMALVLVAAAGGTAAAGESAEGGLPGGGETPKGMGFFPVESSTGTVRVNREIMGVMLQDFRLLHLRTRQGTRGYRLTLRLRNDTGKPAAPLLRVLLWSKEKPEVAFDVRGDERHITIAPRGVLRMRGEFKLAAKTRLSHLTAMPLPSRILAVNLDEPVAVPVEPGAEAPTAGDGTADSNSPSDAELKKQEELARLRDEVLRLYLQQQRIPQANTTGRLMGLGPYGPVYRIPDGSFSGIYVQSPSGWTANPWQPSSIHPRDMWVDPFK